MKLYCDPISTTSRPVMMFIAEAGLPVELVHVDLMNGANFAPDYLAINPNGCVPYLVDGDFRLGESAAILKYLAESTGSPAYPAELRARAKVDEALAWFYTNFHEVYCAMAVYPNFGIPHGLDPAVGQGLIAYGEQHAHRWLAVLDRHMLAGRPFVCGEQITLADYAGAAFVTLGEAAAFDLSAYSNITAWVARLKARPQWGAVYAGFNGMVSAIQSQSRVNV
ncbi:MAG TPA: glutathione S-transferase family protein [Phenylobacterium sp.]